MNDNIIGKVTPVYARDGEKWIATTLEYLDVIGVGVSQIEAWNDMIISLNNLAEGQSNEAD